MFEFTNLVIALCLLLGAVLYTSVGHAGSSAYIAVMTLFNLQSTVIKPTALTLNIAVSAYASWRYIGNKFFDKKLFLFLSLGAIPAAFIGGHINLASEIYKPVVGVLLIISGLRFIFLAATRDREIKAVNYPLAITMGIAIGFLSGITGTGGGIFLSPLIIWLGWNHVKQASGTVAAFIFINSVAGLLGNYRSTSELPDTLPLFLGAVIIGALIGTRLGISRFSSIGVKRALGLVLIIAGLKFSLF
ncbi:COG0730 Predicted permeases [Candidatus Nanopelagicaceae bacterium]